MELWKTGLLDKFISEFNIPNAEECFSKKKSSTKEVPIKFVDLTGAFLILGIGLGAGILCFLIELIFGKYRKEMKLMKDKAPPRPAVKKNNPPPAQPPRPQVQQATIETVKNDGKPQLIRQQNVQEKEELEVVELK